MIVDSIPGTTRDPVDSLCFFQDKRFLLVDTAGIRRKGRVSQKVETYSVVAALKAIERADVALLVMDSTELVSEQVMRIAGYVMDRARALVIVLSKWDLVDTRQLSIKKAEQLVFDKLNFIDFAPLVPVSAMKGDRVDRLFGLIQKVHGQYTRRIKTSDLNSVMQLIVERHPPPAKSGRPTKIYYSNQISVAPPSFVFMTNHPEKTNFSYERYVTNQLRHYFGFEGMEAVHDAYRVVNDFFVPEDGSYNGMSQLDLTKHGFSRNFNTSWANTTAHNAQIIDIKSMVLGMVVTDTQKEQDMDG